MESTSESAPLSAPMAIDTWLSAADGDASGLWFMSLMARMAFPESFVWGEVAAVSQGGHLGRRPLLRAGAAPQGLDPRQRRNRVHLRRRRPDSTHLPPAPDGDEYTRVQDSDVETLLVGGRSTSPRRRSSRRRSCCRTSATATRSCSRTSATPNFWAYESKASTRLLNTFFDSGRVDTSLYTPAKVDFTPDVTQTALGKGFAGTMSACGPRAPLAPADASPRAQARPLRPHGERPARLAVHVVLGLGGWFAGVVVVQLAFPEVPLDDVLLAVTLDRRAGRPRRLPRLGRPRPACREAGRSASAPRPAAPSPAPGSGSTRHGAAGGRHHDRRSGTRRQPRRARPGHRARTEAPSARRSRSRSETLEVAPSTS